MRSLPGGIGRRDGYKKNFRIQKLDFSSFQGLGVRLERVRFQGKVALLQPKIAFYLFIGEKFVQK